MCSKSQRGEGLFLNVVHGMFAVGPKSRGMGETRYRNTWASGRGVIWRFKSAARFVDAFAVCITKTASSMYHCINCAVLTDFSEISREDFD